MNKITSRDTLQESEEKTIEVLGKLVERDSDTEMFEALTRIWNITHKHGIGRVALVAHEFKEQRTLRRILEYTSRVTGAY